MPQSQPDLLQLFTCLPAACLVLDRDLRITMANRTYLATVDRTLEDILGKQVFDAFPEAPDRREMFGNAFHAALNGQDNELVEVPFAIPVPDEKGGGMREIYWTCLHRGVRDSDGNITHMVQNAQDVTERVMAQRLQGAIAHELQHRVGNLFNLTSIIARRSAEGVTDIAEFLSRYDARIQAMAKTHALLTGGNWDGINMRQLLERQLSGHLGDDMERVRLDGEQMLLDSREAQAVSMAVHELATNAYKYGALRDDGGAIDISWSAQPADARTFEWIERNPMAVEPSKRGGFGSTMLTRIVPSQLNGTATRDLTDGGLRYSVKLGVPHSNGNGQADGADAALG